MWVTLSALVVAGAMPALRQSPAQSQAIGAQATVRQSATPVTGRDSTRALRFAHHAQGDFESLRRRLLPHAALTAAPGCDAVVGRYCFVQQMSSDPPQEAPEVVEARARLLTTLDSLGGVLPGDRWILGQRVRYLIEAGRAHDADSLGVDCAATAKVRATTSWCFALVGYTAQQYGKFPRADAAFSMALDELPEPERWKFEDLSQFLGRGAAGPYRHADGEPRDSMTAAFWRLVQPLYLTSENDLRTEFLARLTRMYIEQDSRTVMSDWWGADDRATLLRYGVALWYTQGDRLPGTMGPPPIAGIRREPAFNFFPDAHAFESPDQLTPGDWEFANVESGPTYAPRWANSFQPLINTQVALFRRGDSALIVAAFEFNDGGARGLARQVGIFAAAVDRGGVLPPFGTIEKAGPKVVSTLMAPWRPMIVSLEVLDSANRSAERMRFAPKLPTAGTRLSLSDLLLYTPTDSASAPKSLSEAVPLALNSMTLPVRQIGVFWETYGLRPEGETFDYALEVEPVDQGLIHRALVGLHVVDPDRGLALQWRESPSVAGHNGIASRGVTVDLSRLKPGQYHIRLLLTPAAGTALPIGAGRGGTALPIVAERDIEIL